MYDTGGGETGVSEVKWDTMARVKSIVYVGNTWCMRRRSVPVVATNFK